MICFLIGYTVLILELPLAEIGRNAGPVTTTRPSNIYLQGRFSLDNFKYYTFLLDKRYS
jgi:hypothetical protein